MWIWEFALCLLFLIFDHADSRPWRTVQTLIRSATSPLTPSAANSSGFVFLHLNWEPNLTNLSRGWVKRRYCGWREILIGEFTEYRRVWSDEPIPSDDFLDPNYRNPSTPCPGYEFSVDRQIGEWVLSKELFDSTSTHFLRPSEKMPFEQIYANYVNAGYEPLGQGYACISAAGDLRARVAEVWQEYGEIGNDHVAAMIMENCHVGDVCVRIEIFDPEEVTVFAYNDQGVLKKGEFEGYTIGRVVQGTLRETEVLTELPVDEPMYLFERCLIVALLVWSIWVSASDPSDRNWRFTLVGSTMLWLRSCMWNTVWFDPKKWGPLALAVWIARVVKGRVS
jgi:hypothetical protein